MIDDIDLNKAATIRRCLQRISEEYRDDPSRLDDFTIQDSIVLNILRACEAAIDLAMHRVALGRLGIPQTSRDAFELLAQNAIISQAGATAMKHMVGFRNIAVHNYQNIQTPVLHAILKKHLADFETFLKELSL
ncbi:MAG: DUF86 domain-containing protein [Akkermansiaceae bacterium]|jgi:uncharacterized protein YutE (UPF0331/DUF86 family)|nr:DUF86 domain-containing protein [Akkermansiaceae bacterium]